MVDVEFVSELWRWKGDSPWHFVTVPAEGSAELAARGAGVSPGFGSIPVQATVGRTVWKTSLFRHDGLYLLPVKKAVRGAEELEVGEPVKVQLTVDYERATP